MIIIIGEKVTGGSINVTMKWLVNPGQVITIVKETLDLCDLMVDMGDLCPILVGTHILQYHDMILNIFPKAS